MNRRELLEYAWNVAWQDLVKANITFNRVLRNEWLDENRYSDSEAKDELMSKGKLCFDNLRALKTEIGKKVYCDTFDFQHACYADNHNEEYEEKQNLLERTFYVNCTKKQLIALCDYMNDNEISFEKLANEKLQANTQDGNGFDISKTDSRTLIKYLESFKEMYEAKYEEDKKPIYINHARTIGKLIGKLQSKIKG